MINVLLLAAAMASGSAQIPAAFQGEWNTKLSDCGKKTSDYRLVITATTVDEMGKVKQVTVKSPQMILVKAKYEDEGGLSEDKMVLLRGGQDLAITNGGGTMTRHRCPKR